MYIYIYTYLDYLSIYIILNQNQTESLQYMQYPSPAGSPGSGGSPLQVIYVYEMIHNIQLSRNFRE